MEFHGTGAEVSAGGSQAGVAGQLGWQHEIVLSQSRKEHAKTTGSRWENSGLCGSGQRLVGLIAVTDMIKRR